MPRYSAMPNYFSVWLDGKWKGTFRDEEGANAYADWLRGKVHSEMNRFVVYRPSPGHNERVILDTAGVIAVKVASSDNEETALRMAALLNLHGMEDMPPVLVGLEGS